MADDLLNSRFRTNATTTPFETLLPEDLEAVLKAAAEIPMETEVSDTDIQQIHALRDQVISISAYRAQLEEYLRKRSGAKPYYTSRRPC